MRKIRLIATDMDNTLLTSEGQLPPMTKDRVLALQDAGIRFAVASGRPLYTLKGLFPTLKDEIILVCDNGGMICDRGEVIFDSEITREDYQKMVRFTKENKLGVPLICAIDSAYLEFKDKQYADYLKTFYSKITFVEDLTEVSALADKFTIYLPDEKAKEAYDQHYVPEFGADFSITVTDLMWIDIMNKGVDKGSAMRFLGNYLQIETDQMMAFGDTYNDAEMLETVGYSYLMANASEDMKRYAKYSAPSNDEYGVIKVIDKVLKRA